MDIDILHLLDIYLYHLLSRILSRTNSSIPHMRFSLIFLLLAVLAVSAECSMQWDDAASCTAVCGCPKCQIPHAGIECGICNTHSELEIAAAGELPALPLTLSDPSTTQNEFRVQRLSHWMQVLFGPQKTVVLELFNHTIHPDIASLLLPLLLNIAAIAQTVTWLSSIRQATAY